MRRLSLSRIGKNIAERGRKQISISLCVIKLGGAGDRFGDYLGVDCANLICISGNKHLTNTTFTRPIPKISKSSHHCLPRHRVRVGGSTKFSSQPPPPRPATSWRSINMKSMIHSGPDILTTNFCLDVLNSRLWFLGRNLKRYFETPEIEG